MVQVRSFIAVATRKLEMPSGTRDLTGAPLVVREIDGIQFIYVARPPLSGAVRDENSATAFVLGDTADISESDFMRNSASGVPIRYDASQRLLRIATSIVGMPPVYIYRGSGVTAVTSDIHLLLAIPGVRLQFDPHSVVELASIGHPVEHRTLFSGLTLAESGTSVTLDNQGGVSIVPRWSLPRADGLPWPEFIERQMASFTSAVERIETTGSFLSLTAGLDTRAVFSALAREQRLPTAVTMSGARRLSIDAKIARRLARAYGIEHIIVPFNERFAQQLPTLLERATLLSGGMSSLDQAPEVFLYSELHDRFYRRLSGNLGNQVGRGGTEGVSLRHARLQVLSDEMRNGANSEASHGHWLLGKLNESPHERLQFILRNETVFTSVGNFSIGNHFAVQQTPYADRALIETLGFRPLQGGSTPSGSALQMRLRDLRHRFLGEPDDRSFQRKLVQKIGGYAARCPVNWGWRPVGGVSPTGLVSGVAALGGMVARAKGLDGGALGPVVRASGLPELHDFRNSRQWVKRDLREFANDLFASRPMRDTGVFDVAALQRLADDHFHGRSNEYTTIVFALDLALAAQTFC